MRGELPSPKGFGRRLFTFLLMVEPDWGLILEGQSCFYSVKLSPAVLQRISTIYQFLKQSLVAIITRKRKGYFAVTSSEFSAVSFVKALCRATLTFLLHALSAF